MIYRSSVLTPFFSLVFIAALILPSLASPPSALAKEPDWSQPIAINDYSGVGVEREDPHMVVSGSGKLYVVWVDHRNSRSDVYFSYSADQGSSWSANVQVNDDESGGLYPQVAVDAAGKIYVAWADGSGVYLATSTNNGNSWSAATTGGRRHQSGKPQAGGRHPVGYGRTPECHVAGMDYSHLHRGHRPPHSVHQWGAILV